MSTSFVKCDFSMKEMKILQGYLDDAIRSEWPCFYVLLPGQIGVTSIIFFGYLILFVPIVKYFKVTGLIIWGLVYAIGFVFVLKSRKIQKEYDVNTYKEIVAFSEGKLLDEICN